VRAVAHGEALLAPEVAGRVLGRLTDPPVTPFPQLTPRELEILDHVAAGRPTADIARALGLSVKTVGNTVSNVLAKLGLADRAQAAVVARDAGLGRR
jgi:DNA-binding NarL/FixJ family response regulator